MVTKADAAEIVLRTAQPRDREQIIALINRVAAECRYLQTIRYQPTSNWERLLRLGGDAKTGLWLGVLAQGKEIIGMGRIFADPCHSLLRPIGSLGMVLASRWRNMGLGTMLLAKLIEVAQHAGYSRLRADILGTNQRSLGLFQKFGFQITNMNGKYWPAQMKWVDEFLLERCMKSIGPLHFTL